MTRSSQNVKRTYFLLTLLSTLAASFIWGVNTLFLLDAGLSNTEAFAANAFFTLGQVIFEVPTGVVADTWGRRTSYALGVATLLVTTLVYFWLWQIHGPFWAWALVSILLGLGFTFFSGATEAWLVDALHSTGFQGNLESVFAKGQSFGGIAMLVGSFGGGLVAQYTNLGVPYILRAVVLGLTLVICLAVMRDWGFEPQKGMKPLRRIKNVWSSAMENGWRNRPVRLMMLSAPFAGMSIYVFYAMQPHLLRLYGDEKAYGVAGLAAAIVAGAQIVGGLSVGKIRAWFSHRTTMLIGATIVTAITLVLLGLIAHFWAAIALLVIWGLLFAIISPMRQAYLNGLIESNQRATVLSFDSLMGSAGGAITQPALGKVADVYGYGPSFIVCGVIEVGALPFLIAAKKQKAKSDTIS